MLIVFDLDDTLIDTSGFVIPQKLREVLTFLISQGISVGSFEEALALALERDRQCAGSDDTIKKTLDFYGAAAFLRHAQAIYSNPLPPNFCIPTTPRAKEVLHALVEMGRKLAVVTRGQPDYQQEKLQKAGLEASLFSKIIISEGPQKRLCYEVLLEEFALPPGDCIVVGDRVWADLWPAHELGFQTIHMRWGRGMREKGEKWIDRSICTLPELLDMV